MRTVIARFFDCTLDGLAAREDTDLFQLCRDRPDDPGSDAWNADTEASADVHIMGRVHYEQMAAYFPTADHPWAAMLNAARKVVFSRTLTAAEWENTTIARGDLAEEVGKLKRDGDGYLLASGGVSFWRALARLDLIDEYRVNLVPYLAGTDGLRLLDDIGVPRQLDLVSSTAFGDGTIGLRYRRHR